MLLGPGHGQEQAPGAHAGELLAEVQVLGDKLGDDVHLVPRGESKLSILYLAPPLLSWFAGYEEGLAERSRSRMVL